MKEKTPPICMCKNCIRSSNAGNKCVFEEPVYMAYCQTYRFNAPKVKSTKKK